MTAWHQSDWFQFHAIHPVFGSHAELWCKISIERLPWQWLASVTRGNECDRLQNIILYLVAFSLSRSSCNGKTVNNYVQCGFVSLDVYHQCDLALSGSLQTDSSENHSPHNSLHAPWCQNLVWLKDQHYVNLSEKWGHSWQKDVEMLCGGQNTKRAVFPPDHILKL